MIGADSTARKHRVRTPLECITQEELEFPNLVTAIRRACEIIAFDPDLIATRSLGDRVTAFNRGRQGCELANWKSPEGLELCLQMTHQLKPVHHFLMVR